MSAVRRAVLTSRAFISAGHATSRGLLRNPKSSADHTNLAGCSTWSVAQILARRAFASSGRLSKPPKKTKAEKIAQTRPAQESARAVKSEDTGETIGSYEEAAAMSKDSFDFMADEDGGEFHELEDLTADDNVSGLRGVTERILLILFHRDNMRGEGIKLHPFQLYTDPDCHQGSNASTSFYPSIILSSYQTLRLRSNSFEASSMIEGLRLSDVDGENR